ncbi:ATP-binding protein [Actinomadura sp. GC306]|uniref:sensor histidine kinase n=1 Tax=Actinomadura sp. GC306 TaxID=2530367 RepID=UPI001405121B|nr:ATP-binding protein [Actinomadura sp. GC306]
MPIFRGRWSPSRWSMRTRVSVTATLFVAVLLAAGAVLFYLVVQSVVNDNLRDESIHAVNELAELVRTTDPRGRLRTDAPEVPVLQVVDDVGSVLAASPQMEGYGPLEVPEPRMPDALVQHTINVPGKGTVFVASERVHSRGGWRIVHAGAPVDELDQYRGLFVGLLAAVVLIGTAAVGYIVSAAVRRALLPVRVMSSELAGITGRAPDRRVSVPHPDDDVSHLAEAVNVTLERLEDVLARQRDFVADVSHELRSPLTGLRAQLELALEHPESEDWPAVARAALADADRLQGIVGDLLILAKLGAGVRAGQQRVDLAALVRAEVARRGRRVPVEVDAERDTMVRATPHHLVRVLTNLLDNAERHAASRIRVTVDADGPDAVLEVLDDGAGIPPEDRERVFWRFHRLAESRRLDSGGTGLGLTISRDIARAHGGSLVAADSDRGARLVLRIPLDKS